VYDVVGLDTDMNFGAWPSMVGMLEMYLESGLFLHYVCRGVCCNFFLCVFSAHFIALMSWRMKPCVSAFSRIPVSDA